MPEMVEYFVDDEGLWIYAARGSSGTGGLLKLPYEFGLTVDWKRLVPLSETWSAVHQRIYRAGTVARLEPDLLSRLPPLPPLELRPAAQTHPAEFATSSYPRLAAWLSAQAGGSGTMWLVLHEDTYETSSGDGAFYYLKYVVLTKAEAEERVRIVRQGYARGHLRSVIFLLREDVVQVQLEHQTFDCAKQQEVATKAEEILRDA